MNPIRSLKNLTKGEMCLWFASLIGIIVPYCFFENQSILTLAASLVGVTALIFVAKGDVTGQALALVFSVFYAVISYTFRYYGEMITYMFMSAPIALMSVIEWIRHPFSEEKQEVEVNHIGKKETIFMLLLSAAVTAVFYFILKFFNTANLPVSTLSVTTSFLASYLMFRRCAFYALAYAANDCVLIALCIYASMHDASYLPMIICFAVFFVNDIYGFINWKRMGMKQKNMRLHISEI